MYFFDFDYPGVRQSLGMAALREAYPTLLLNLRGDICGVNPLALWLWGALQPGETLHPERLMGVNAFTLAAQQIDRMPVEQNEEMYAKASAIVKRGVARHFESAFAIYGDFIEAMKADLRRTLLYEAAPLYPDKEWEYALNILHPQDASVMLEYAVSVYRLSGEAGFLVVYYPRTSALPVNEAMHKLFIEQYGQGDDVITWRIETRGSLSVPPVPASLASAYRPYYPILIQDPLWYLRGENEAHRLLVGTSVLNLHFFEMFLAPIVRLLLGPIQDSTAPRALKYFDVFTEPYLKEDHELHAEYMQLMKRLAQVEGFSEFLAFARRLPIHINPAALLNLYAASEAPFYTCRVLLPWRYEPDIRLQFKSMVNLIFPDAMVVRPDIRSYQITLVPENDETDVALMLLPHLAGQRPEWRDEPLAQQFLWLLAIVKMVEEGRQDGEDDTMWNPQDAYKRALQGLALRYDTTTEDEIKTIIAEIQATIEVMDRNGDMDKGKLLALLRSYTITEPSLQALTDFLTQEIKAQIQMRRRNRG